MVRHGLSILDAFRFSAPTTGPGLSVGLALLVALGLPGAADAQGLDRASWTVDHTWTSTEDVEFDVTEGTWMNLDVSPDGRMISDTRLGRGKRIAI